MKNTDTHTHSVFERIRRKNNHHILQTADDDDGNFFFLLVVGLFYHENQTNSNVKEKKFLVQSCHLLWKKTGKKVTPCNFLIFNVDRKNLMDTNEILYETGSKKKKKFSTSCIYVHKCK